MIITYVHQRFYHWATRTNNYLVSKDFLVTVQYVALSCNKLIQILNVPDRKCRVIPEVVIVRRRVFQGLGKLERGGWGGGWVKGGQFTSNLGLRWTDRVTARRVPSK